MQNYQGYNFLTSFGPAGRSENIQTLLPDFDFDVKAPIEFHQTQQTQKDDCYKRPEKFEAFDGDVQEFGNPCEMGPELPESGLNQGFFSKLFNNPCTKSVNIGDVSKPW